MDQEQQLHAQQIIMRYITKFLLSKLGIYGM